MYFDVLSKLEPVYIARHRTQLPHTRETDTEGEQTYSSHLCITCTGHHRFVSPRHTLILSLL